MQTKTDHFDLASWRAAASATFGTLHVQPADKWNFSTALSTVVAGEISLFNMYTPAHVVERREADISPNAVEQCKISLQLEGTTTVYQDGRKCSLDAGQMALYVTQRPYRLELSERQRSLIILFPQSFVQLPARVIEQITAVPLAKTHGLGRVAIPLFEQLTKNFEVLSGPHAGELLRSSLDMLVTAFISRFDLESGLINSGDSILARAYDHINAHLADPSLGPSTIAAALFVSVRHLHAQFAATEETVGSCIRRRRLERIRRDLAHPLHADEPIQAIGARWGIPDASYLSRAFKAEFGVGPRAYRHSASETSS